QTPRMLVAAVLAPHRAEHAQLELVRLATQPLDDRGVLAGQKTEGAEEALVSTVDEAPAHPTSADCRTAAASDSKMHRPSWLPSSGSLARSGWGIRANTLPVPLMMPAILSAEPFGLAAAVTLPFLSQKRRTTVGFFPSAST